MVDRVKLDTLIAKNNYKNWWQPELFVTHTKHKLPPELVIIIDPPEEQDNYNCFVYAFGLHTDKEILKQINGFIYDSFVKHLLDIGELQRTDSPKSGDFVVYQDLGKYPENLTHIGILEGDGVVSKWAWGPLVRHSLWDVPSEYGDDIFYIKSVDKKTAHDLLVKHISFNQP